jgi:hypothetical protein
MHALPISDPIAWLLVSYLFGTLACGAWTVLAESLRLVQWQRRRDPAS